MTEHITTDDLKFLTKHGITLAEAKAIFHRARKEAEYRAYKDAVQRAKDLAYEKLSPFEKLKQAWDRKVRNLKWEADNC